ncbi:MAG: carbamoyltransferase HypF [Desulfobacterales bacterium]|nr:carbamoyltransferase HypF [Desulfobacterales bacterium]
MTGTERIARKLIVRGIVQGVGFRPFIYQLAARHNLTGDVANTSSGVIILAEGPADKVTAFVAAIEKEKPPLAHITDITSEPADRRGADAFVITASRKQSSRSALISPDVSICADCRRELFDPDDRRYRYPFINCTNCGPRYTIIDDIPYDRPKTSMRHFTMCPHCQAEYDDPLNRRFHAQPNACPVCGPQCALLDADRREVDDQDPIKTAARLLKRGHILAIKGLGGFHLAVDAENAAAVALLRRRKHREEKPFAVMSPDLEVINTYARLDTAARSLLTSIQRPIVLLDKKQPGPIAESVAPLNRYFGVMLPYTPLHYLILSEGFTALVMTSGNMSEEPICIDNDDAFKRLEHIADYFLVHDRGIYLRSDDSIVRQSAGETRFLRRSRGYVPVPVFLKQNLPPVLACGAGLKNTVCLTKEDRAFVSQHIGDLENQETLDFFELTIRHLKRILDIAPEIVAHDLHPDYLSSQYALAQTSCRLVGVQHHHAHIVSAMAENHLDGPVIGLAFDGTGLGTDGKIWGGEILVSELHDFKRAGYFDYVPMPGSNAAIKEPWRMALSYLYRAFGDQVTRLDLPLFQTVTGDNVGVILQMIQKGLNSPDTSSLGRLFDGVAAIIGIRDCVRFEGQAAMELEMIADPDEKGFYDWQWTRADACYCIDPAGLVSQVVDDCINRVPAAVVSRRFHNTLTRLFAALCDAIRVETGLDRVVLSGGVFQNATLLNALSTALAKMEFKVYSQKLVPANDGGISLGQAVAAAAMAKRQDV